MVGGEAAMHDYGLVLVDCDMFGNGPVVEVVKVVLEKYVVGENIFNAYTNGRVVNVIPLNRSSH